MSETGLKLAQDKMAAAGIAQQAIDVFTYYYRQLEEGVSGFIPEDTIEPLVDPPMLSDVAVSEADAAAALERAVIIKLNGGLGTSMGMDKAKSLLPVRKGKTFLDIIVDQVRHARAAYRIPLPRGSYTLTLHFFEGMQPEYRSGPFDVLVEGQPILRSFDPLSSGSRPTTQRWYGSVDDGVLDIDLIRRGDGFPSITGIEVEAAPRAAANGG